MVGIDAIPVTTATSAIPKASVIISGMQNNSGIAIALIMIGILVAVFVYFFILRKK
jgi:hypothetical protein